jgi:hypothetical protein
MAASISARAHRKELAREALLARLQAISQTARVLAATRPAWNCNSRCRIRSATRRC